MFTIVSHKNIVYIVVVVAIKSTKTLKTVIFSPWCKHYCLGYCIISNIGTPPKIILKPEGASIRAEKNYIKAQRVLHLGWQLALPIRMSLKTSHVWGATRSEMAGSEGGNGSRFVLFVSSSHARILSLPAGLFTGFWLCSLVFKEAVACSFPHMWLN